MTSSHLAVVFDFDDTLVADSTTAFLAHKGIDVTTFWNAQAKQLVAAGYDQPLHYLQLMLDMVHEGSPLEGVTPEELRTFGASLDDSFFPGLPEMFDELSEAVASYRDLTLDYYIISSGIQELIEGSKTVQKYFSAVYACRFGTDADTGVIRHIRRCVTFTEKTRYLFEINKGIDPADSNRNPGLVNREVPPEQRRIPFENIIYVGDGLTDIPCFSLVKHMGGIAFAVFDPRKEASAQRALKEFLKAGRTIGSHSPRYGSNDDLGALIRAAVNERASAVSLAARQAPLCQPLLRHPIR
jgi:phosphoserine phosphatase